VPKSVIIDEVLTKLLQK